MAEYTYHEAPAHNATALPVMLPGKLVGRDQTLAAVYGELKQNRPVLLYGPAGYGKSAIAATLASAYTQQSGGALWLGVDEDSLGQLIVRVARAYGDTEIANSENPTGMVGAVATTLAQNKPLIVLDGNPLIPAAREFVRQVADGLPVMIVTDESTDDDWKQVEIAPLADADAATLISEKAGNNAPEMSQVAALLGNIPLALLVAAGTARIAQMDGAALLSALEETDEEDPVTRALTVGFSKLQQGLQGILLMLGATFEGQASLELLTMLSGAQQATVQKVMTILAASGFVQQDMRYGTSYFYMHPSVHSYTQRFLASSGRLRPLQEKVRDTVVAYAKKYSEAGEEAHDKLSLEMGTFLSTVHWSSEQGEGDVSSQIVVALSQADGFVKGRGYLYELLQLQEGGSSGVSAFPANAMLPPEALENDFDGDDEEEEILYDDPETIEANAALSPEDLMSGGGEALDENDPDSLRMAIMEARGDDDRERELELQEKLSKLLLAQGKPTEAMSAYNELLVSYEEEDDEEKIVETRLELARLMVRLGSPQAAVLHATQGAKMAEELGQQEDQMRFLIILGDARQQLGESTDAILAYSHALDIAQATGDKKAEATAQMQLGFAQLDDDDAEIAIKTWDTALALCRELEMRDCEGRILGGLGTAYGELNRWEEAINFHNSALYIAREVDDKKEEALQLSNLGYAAREARKLGDAVLRYRQALHLAYENDAREDIVSNIVDLARILSESKLHLDIADMLVSDALTRDPNDREVLDLKQKLTTERMQAVADGLELRPVKGTAQEYAAAAYSLLEEA